MQVVLALSLFFIVGSSCSSQNIVRSVSTNPVFSEIDTFITTSKKAIISKRDYYLIKGGDDLKNGLKLFLDTIASRISGQNSGNYDDYLLFFYKEDSDLNEKSVLAEPPEYRYKIFTDYRNDNLIACYNYRDSKFFYIDWGPKFEKSNKESP
jgi:hypothetical protein